MATKNGNAEFKKLLQSIKARLRGDVDQLTQEALSASANGSKSPTHMAELGTQSYEQEFSLQFIENDQEVLNEIDDALYRIEQGTYGQCEGCLADNKSAAKSRIPKGRLRVIPYARNCVECERKREELLS
ncbi:hypothetical protein MNBD_PLANCTO02-2818 [hydrothermal vent metagenome]|uniref:Uncharacterized protein n=2 Tax=hydrothermal vent metagenome TaxID=652676 RepID=A0A3B1DPA5_9ZZZZ